MWQETDQGLYRHFEFENFTEAFTFMGKVAELAEQQGHHPRWTNEYNTVDIWLSTHEANGRVTDKDRQMAQAIDELMGR